MSRPRPPRWPKDPPPRTVASPAVEALCSALAAGADPAARTAAFWAAAADRGTPLVEEVPGAPGERTVTFLWRDRHGAGPGTREVLLLANKLTDPSVAGDSALLRVDGTDVWWRAYRLASSWRGTYTLAADDGEADPQDAALGPASRWSGTATRSEHDARNPDTFPSASGDVLLSVLELPDAPEQPHAHRPAAAARGRVDEVVLPAVGGTRRGWVHVPAGTGEGPHRLLVLLDGDEWAGRRDGIALLDALHHDGAIPPTITLLVDAGDVPTRWADMAAGDDYLDLISTTLPAWARDRHPIGAGREDVVLAGQSLGGLAVLRAASRSPERIGAVISQSASLWWDGQEAADAPSPTVEDLRDRPPAGVRVHAQVGRDEWVLLQAHRALAGALADAGVEHELVEYEGGHDPLCWRAGLGPALIAVSGAPRP